MKSLDFLGFPTYSIDESGNVYNSKTKIFLKHQIAINGYLMVNLSHKKLLKYVTIHRLVALTFLPNPDNLPVVMHLDENKLNCHISNLKWATYGENNKAKYAAEIHKVHWLGKHGKNHPWSKPIIGYTDDYEFNQKFENAIEAAKIVNIISNHISSVCTQHPDKYGRTRKSCGKFNNKPIRWKYL